MKILVTGCAGFIGSHLCEKLIQKGHEVIGLDNFDPFYDKWVKQKNLSTIIDKFQFLDIDISNEQQLQRTKIKGIDLVIHLAAKTGVRPSIEDNISYIKTNILGTQNVVNFLARNNIRKYVFASSSSVYGNTRIIPFCEDFPCNNPISPYAYSKKSGEMINFTYHDLYNIDTINLRFFTVFGPRQRPDLAIHKFVKLIKSGQPIELFGDGSSARDYTYVDDIISGILKSVDFIVSRTKVFETFNLGNSYPVKLMDLVNIIFSSLDMEPNYSFKSMQPGDVNNTYADISKAKKILGYNPETNIETGIRNFVNWYNENH